LRSPEAFVINAWDWKTPLSGACPGLGELQDARIPIDGALADVDRAVRGHPGRLYGYGGVKV